MLAPAPLGLRTIEHDLTTGLRLTGRAERTVVEHYTMTTGKRRERTNRMAEQRLSFAGAAGARLDVVVRVAPDGVAYRYELPTAAAVTGEASAFALPADAPAWVLPCGPQYENDRVATTAGGAAAGESVSGRWTVTVGPSSGYVDVPVFVPPPPLTGTPYVSDVPFVSETNGWGPVERDGSVNESDGGDGNPLTIGGVVYAKGLGTHAPAEVTVYLGGRCRAFTASAGLDDETTQPG